MILKLKKSDFLPLLSKVQNLIEKRTSLQTLLNILIETRIVDSSQFEVLPKIQGFKSQRAKNVQNVKNVEIEKKTGEKSEVEEGVEARIGNKVKLKVVTEEEEIGANRDTDRDRTRDVNAEVEVGDKKIFLGRLKVFATNLEVGFVGEIPVYVSEVSRQAVNAKSLFEILRELPQEEVFLSSYKNHWLRISQGASFFNIAGIPPESFPDFPSFETCEFVSMKPETLKTMIEKTLYCISVDDTRRHLSGVYFEKIGGGHYRMVAMSPHRLTFVERSIERPLLDKIEDAKGVIIPKKGLLELNLFLDEALRQGASVDISVDETQFILRLNQSFLMVHLINDRYPDYRRLIPKSMKNEIHIQKDLLLSSLRRVAVLCHQESKFVLLNFKKGKLELTSHDTELGSAKEELDVSYEGDHVQIGFNVNYIMEALKSIGGEEVFLNFKNASSPGLIKPLGDSSQSCIIMPMRFPG